MRRILVVLVLATMACSVRKYATRQLGEALAHDVDRTFSSDNDPELIHAASPFALKLVEAMIERSPKDTTLLLAAANGFTQYSYAFVQMDADEIESNDRATATALRQRATKLYIRARDYGMRGLQIKHPNFAADLKANPKTAVEELTTKEVPLMYWTGAAWAGALAASRDMFMLPQVPQFEALMERVLQLDDTYDHGAVHTFMITFEMASPTRRGDRAARAKQHFDRAVELGAGHQVAPYVA